ncbi:MAG: class I adenylate-forming enzyme family protein, partial [Syntrophales bacterium]|nr:class I adenylate-forming enzyme family protein [Syntrophales bacterium]
EWRLPNYGSIGLSSLRFVIYGGQAVSREFREKMARMSPKIGTGLGLTETAGFCTYTDLDAGVDDLVQGIGYDMPLCPLTIREPMRTDGTAGAEKAPGAIGEICFSGPQIFLGYLGDPENTAKTVSKDGVCYTGDLGFYDEKGLHFAGRSKMVIKPKGYQVFPDDIESHIAGKLSGRIGGIAVVGVEHHIFSEAVMAIVESADPLNPVTPADVLAACDDIAAYARPSHVEILRPGEMPLNRVAKTDYVELKKLANGIVARLRAAGKWDS